MKIIKFNMALMIALIAFFGCTKETDLVETELMFTATSSIALTNFTGECPKKFEFEGLITVNEPVTVTYTWLRSDGETAPENTLEFTEAGSKTVSTSWTLGANGNSYEDYWQQLKIVSPRETLSDKAEFNLQCEENPEISVSAVLEGDAEFTGQCPRKFDFTGEITVNQPMTVTYTWLRSDGETAPENSLEFTDAGSKTVSTNWTLGANGNSYEDYWQQLKIITPEDMLSEKAVFNLNCEEGLIEDCISFDYNSLFIEEVGDLWIIKNGRSSLLSFRTFAKAQLAVSIIKYYKMDSQCFAIRPNAELSYYTVAEELPTGSYPGEDCIAIIDPNNLTIRKNNETSYSIIGDSSIYFNARSLEEAHKIVALFEKYQPKYTCFVERPGAGMVYLRE
ncbi:MAG TPA: hypothetical protein ENH87_04305 [Pricia antarctica]|uniref:Ig-like domain-containing protein n=1 Tax=Pricia antarctica TaxID=641691 RepID=A0A831VPY6_9FLAO|nr:hypothetical protein [Pricia antarctica]